MARCGYCDSTIFGGVSDGGRHYCNAACHERGQLLDLANQLPGDLIQEQVRLVHQGECPKCGGRGPVDVFTAHYVWSLVFFTSWNSSPQICCRSCGVKANLLGTLSSALFGWWGIPWGIAMTPVQIGRNIAGLFTSCDPDKPSPQFERTIKVLFAASALEEHQRDTAQA